MLKHVAITQVDRAALELDKLNGAVIEAHYPESAVTALTFVANVVMSR